MRWECQVTFGAQCLLGLLYVGGSHNSSTVGDEGAVLMATDRRNYKPKQTREVFVVVRHTRAGDYRSAVMDEKVDAMERAESIAEAAARDYGYGSASVFPATLTITGKALRR